MSAEGGTMRSNGAVLGPFDGHTLRDAWGEFLARLDRLARLFEFGAGDKIVSDVRVRRLGVHECNGRALM